MLLKGLTAEINNKDWQKKKMYTVLLEKLLELATRSEMYSIVYWHPVQKNTVLHFVLLYMCVNFEHVPFFRLI